MKVIRDNVFQSMNVVIDDSSFQNCTFKNCTLLYRGGTFKLEGNHFIGETNMLMDGPAANTMDLLRGLHAAGGGLKTIAAAYISGIKGDPLSPQAFFERRDPLPT